MPGDAQRVEGWDEVGDAPCGAFQRAGGPPSAVLIAADHPGSTCEGDGDLPGETRGSHTASRADPQNTFEHSSSTPLQTLSLLS